jgi:hypothetical protein
MARVEQGLAQAANRILAHPGPVDVERELQYLLEQRHAGIGHGKPQDGPGRARLDRIVDDAPLQLQRHAAQAEHTGGQKGKDDLMPARAAHHITHDRPRQSRAFHAG